MAITRYVVGRAADLPPGSRCLVDVPGRRGGIGVFNVAGRFYALRNLCPHRGGPLCLGRLRPYYLPTEVGAYAFERDGEIVKCPWHEYEFEIASGACVVDERLRVQTYPVVEEHGEVAVYVE
jgi:3-phenylpropionate/trans-cinnamate dioxygenase ferredoxin subunit